MGATPNQEQEGEEKGKKGKQPGATAACSVTMEGLGDDVGDLNLDDEKEMEEEEGSYTLEEGFRGFDSPVMLSPTGSVVCEGDEEDEDEE